jgi:hypothetical protein
LLFAMDAVLLKLILKGCVKDALYIYPGYRRNSRSTN